MCETECQTVKVKLVKMKLKIKLQPEAIACMVNFILNKDVTKLLFHILSK